jgi:hypothetical protein
VQQEAVLGQKPCEQQTVPLLVSALRHEERLRLFVAAELAPLLPKAVTKCSLCRVEVPRLVAQEHAKALDYGPGCDFGGTPGGEHGGLELLA